MKRLTSSISYIWQHNNWPHFTWDSQALLPLLGQARLKQGKLLKQVQGLGLPLGREAQGEILIEEALKTSAIEGEKLNSDSVRSSVSRRLGLSQGGLVPSNLKTDGLVEVLLDATQNYQQSLRAGRLKAWQAALFPTGYSGLAKIRVGKWRGQEPMQVLSGPMGREKVHYEAPPGKTLGKEMKRFFTWWKNSLHQEEGLLRAGTAHFYFVTIHPFEDGNGRLARALTDMALAQDEDLKVRYYSLSSQVMAERQQYYRVLEKCQKGKGDITPWLLWFLTCYGRAVEGSKKLIADILAKAGFWQKHQKTSINQRQRKVMNRLLEAGREGFEGGLTTRKYVSLTKTSRATAYREITDLLKKGILKQRSAKGRSVSYEIKF